MSHDENGGSRSFNDPEEYRRYPWLMGILGVLLVLLIVAALSNAIQAPSAKPESTTNTVTNSKVP